MVYLIHDPASCGSVEVLSLVHEFVQALRPWDRFVLVQFFLQLFLSDLPWLHDIPGSRLCQDQIPAVDQDCELVTVDGQTGGVVLYLKIH